MTTLNPYIIHNSITKMKKIHLKLKQISSAYFLNNEMRYFLEEDQKF